MRINDEFSIEKVTDAAKFGGLRALWSKVFGDSEEYVDWMYETLKGSVACVPEEADADEKALGEIEGFVVTDAEGMVVSALTLYKCGEFNSIPVYVSYAVCTDPEYRGLGLASELVCYVKGLVIEVGGISLVSPAEQSLVEFYEELGYEQFFMVNEAVAYPDYMLDYDFDEDDDFEPFDPGLSVMPCDASVYNMYREAFLADVPHIELDEKILMVASGGNYAEENEGMYIINGGDAVCSIIRNEAGELYILELLVNPMLTEFSFEIESEIAARLAKYLETVTLAYRSVGYGKCQSMIAGDLQTLNSEVDTDAADGYGSDADEGGVMRHMPPYFGFPLD